jgi:hypothetical protein
MYLKSNLLLVSRESALVCACRLWSDIYSLVLGNNGVLYYHDVACPRSHSLWAPLVEVLLNVGIRIQAFAKSAANRDI